MKEYIFRGSKKRMGVDPGLIEIYTQEKIS
jgi:hypothetical protein